MAEYNILNEIDINETLSVAESNNIKKTINTATIAYFLNKREIVKIHEKDGSEHKEGIDFLINILGKHMDLPTFESEDIYKFAIKKSGGIISDLFKLVSDASLQARLDKRNKISIEDMEISYSELKSTYERTCVRTDFNIFKNVIADTNKNAIMMKDECDSRITRLFERGLLIKYEEQWCDVHPVVVDILALSSNNERESIT